MIRDVTVDGKAVGKTDGSEGRSADGSADGKVVGKADRNADGKG